METNGKETARKNEIHHEPELNRLDSPSLDNPEEEGGGECLDEKDVEENHFAEMENGETEDDENEYDDLVSSDPPIWRLEPSQRITYKTVAGAIGVLTLFMIVLFWVNGPKAFDRMSGNDLVRDGLKGPVQSVEYWRISNDSQFEQIAYKPLRFIFFYDRNGNREREEYFDSKGSADKQVFFRHDSGGHLIDVETIYSYGTLANSSADKQFGLFDPILIELLRQDKNITDTYFGNEYDEYGNWTKWNYHVRRNTRHHESGDIGVEYRRIHYYSETWNPSPKPPLLYPDKTAPLLIG